MATRRRTATTTSRSAASTIPAKLCEGETYFPKSTVLSRHRPFAPQRSTDLPVGAGTSGWRDWVISKLPLQMELACHCTILSRMSPLTVIMEGEMITATQNPITG